MLVVGAEDFNLMRTEALLGMLALQHNDLGSGHAHLHRYLAMVTQSRFHDERNWPLNLTEIEVQERRRLVSTHVLNIIGQRHLTSRNPSSGRFTSSTSI